MPITIEIAKPVPMIEERQKKPILPHCQPKLVLECIPCTFVHYLLVRFRGYPSPAFRNYYTLGMYFQNTIQLFFILADQSFTNHEIMEVVKYPSRSCPSRSRENSLRVSKSRPFTIAT